MVHFWNLHRMGVCPCERRMPTGVRNVAGGPPRASAAGRSPMRKPLSLLATPGLYLVTKFAEYRRQQQEQQRRRQAERELENLNIKIDKLLSSIDEHEGDLVAEEDECVVCLASTATMQTFPCAHKVVCRKCFIRTIQVAVSQRSLPLRCVICRSRILKLKHAAQGHHSSGDSSGLEHHHGGSRHPPTPKPSSRASALKSRPPGIRAPFLI